MQEQNWPISLQKAYLFESVYFHGWCCIQISLKCYRRVLFDYKSVEVLLLIGAQKQQTITWINEDFIQWRKYAPPVAPLLTWFNFNPSMDK